MLSDIVEQFAKGAPVATMFRAIYSRILSDESIDRIFVENSERQVTSDVLLSYLVDLLSSVVTKKQPSINCAHQQRDLAVSRQAIYDKLKGLELTVAQALIGQTSSELVAVLKKLRLQRKDIIAGHHTFVIDGKTYNATEHRLLETRTDSRQPLPGRMIAILDTRYELFTSIQCDMNAHRCERKIVEPLLEHLEPQAVYIADRNFSDSAVLEGIINADAYFIVRKHGVCPSMQEIAGARAKKYRTRALGGGQVSEKQVMIKLASGKCKRVRLITVKLSSPNRKGDRRIHILSNVPSHVKGTQIANAYRGRWTIETCLGYLSQSLNAEVKTLCYPAAAGMCFSVALLLFNIMSSLKTILQQHAVQPDPDDPIEVSYYYMAVEIKSHIAGLNLILPEQVWVDFERMSLARFSKWLAQVASHAKLRYYRKHYRSPKKPPPKRKFNGSRHAATQKILEQRK